MNERIKELEKLAFDAIWDLNDSTIGPSTHFRPDGFEGKFAELLLLDLINGIKDIQTANKCVYTTFDKSIADCVKNEIIKLIETTYNVKV